MSNWDSTPWAVGGGADNSAETARTAVWASTNGAEGIVWINDLKVVPRDIPGPGVNVSPGSLLALSRYAGADRQTYTARLGIVDPVDVPTTGSSGGRNSLVAVIIDDPSQTGDGSAGPADPENYQYVSTVVIPNVSATVTKLQDVPGYTYATGYAIARIAQPANNGTITAAMITDLRAVANPRRRTEFRTLALVGDDQQTLTSTSDYPTGGQTWPLAAEDAWGAIPIPDWATRARIVMTWAGIYQPPGKSRGYVWVQVAPTANTNNRKTQAVVWDSPNANDPSRFTAIAADDIAIPAALRGTSQKFYPRANAQTNVAQLSIDYGSAMILQVEFIEQAA